jgi:hypothetical protein
MMGGKMKPLARQKLDAVHQTRSNLFGWRGQFTPEWPVLTPSNSRELETSPTNP